MYLIKFDRIKSRHIKTLKRRMDYLSVLLDADNLGEKKFQRHEFYALKALMYCIEELPENQESQK